MVKILSGKILPGDSETPEGCANEVFVELSQYLNVKVINIKILGEFDMNAPKQIIITSDKNKINFIVSNTLIHSSFFHNHHHWML